MPSGDPICDVCGLYLSAHRGIPHVPIGYPLMQQDQYQQYLNKNISIQRPDLLEKIDSLERHITWMQTVSTEQVETIRELRRTIQRLEDQIKGI